MSLLAWLVQCCRGISLLRCLHGKWHPLAVGNSVIVKPAELTSLSAYRMVELAYEAGVPKGALSLVCGLGEKVGEALGRHHDVDVVSFTGSTEVGRLFLKYSAESNLKEIVLECGEKPSSGV